MPIWTKAEVNELHGTLRTMRKIIVDTEEERQALAHYIESIGLTPVY